MKAVSNVLMAVIIVVLACSRVVWASDWYNSHCDGNEYGDYCIDISVESLRQFASTSGSVYTENATARAANWISGGAAEWEDENWESVDGYYNNDNSLSPWCGTVHATGNFWAIEGAPNFTWHLVSGWQDSDVSVNTGFCM